MSAPAQAWACSTSSRCRRGQQGSSERATELPRDVLFYPHVLYGGDAAYLAEGKWYRPGVAQWVVFTEEPLELEMLRHTLEPERTSMLEGQ